MIQLRVILTARRRRAAQRTQLWIEWSGEIKFGQVQCKEDFFDFSAVGLISLGLSSLGLFLWHQIVHAFILSSFPQKLFCQNFFLSFSSTVSFNFSFPSSTHLSHLILIKLIPFPITDCLNFAFKIIFKKCIPTFKCLCALRQLA